MPYCRGWNQIKFRINRAAPTARALLVNDLEPALEWGGVSVGDETAVVETSEVSHGQGMTVVMVLNDEQLVLEEELVGVTVAATKHTDVVDPMGIVLNETRGTVTV
jgi:hypothetical protein